MIYSPLTNHDAQSRPVIVNDVCVAMTIVGAHEIQLWSTRTIQQRALNSLK